MTRIVLSFDDGRKDNYINAAPILVKYGIPAVFNITTDYVMQVFDENCPCKNSSMEKEDVIEMSRNPLFEIAGHGKKHSNDLENLTAGVRELEKWTGRTCMGVASPNSRLNYDAVRSNREKYEDCGIHYVRLGDRLGKFSFAKKCIRRLNRHINSGVMYRFVYSETCINKKDRFVYPAVPVMSNVSVNEITEMIEYGIRKDLDLILMFHSICGSDEDYSKDAWSWDLKHFEDLCIYLSKQIRNGAVAVVKMSDLAGCEE